ncbi:MAG: transcription-repair coupling factor, partial [Actinomycetota bacterium]
MTPHPLIQELGQAHPNHALAGEFFAPVTAHPVVINQWLANSNRPLVVITPSARQAEEIASATRELSPNLEVIEFPSWETLPHERLSPAAETVGRRLRALHRMLQLKAENRPYLVLMSVRAALQPVLGGLEAHPPILISRGEEYLLPELALKLIEIGYQRVDMVVKRGEFAIRGGILDVFPTTSEHALRLEFFGDELEDVREFSVADQRSVESQVDHLDIYPARELLITPQVALRAREMAHEFPNLTQMLEKISNGMPVEGMESLAPALGVKLGPITDYLGKDAIVVLQDPQKIEQRAESLIQTNEEFLHAAWDAAISGSQAPIDLSGGNFFTVDEFIGKVQKTNTLVSLNALLGEGARDLGFREIPRFTPEQPATEWLADLAGQQHKIAIMAHGHGSAERVLEVLTKAELPAILTGNIGQLAQEHITVSVGQFAHGFAHLESKLVLFTESEFFGVASSYLAPSERKLARRRGQQVDPLSLKQGDYVVHEIHGIGRFKELVQRPSGVGARQHFREYLLIEYAPPKRNYPADTLFVPTDQLDMLTRYVGGEAPVLSKMGGTDWARVKGNARKAVRKIAIDLVKLYSARMKSRGHAFGPDTHWQQELEDSFTFQETPDQLTTIEEVKRDMEKPIPMDRLLAGDVGYGKTEVAVRAAFKAIQ